MPFFLYLPPGSSSSLREAEYAKRKKGGEEVDVELEEEVGRVERTPYLPSSFRGSVRGATRG